MKEPSETNPLGGCPVHEGMGLPPREDDPLNPEDPNGGVTIPPDVTAPNEPGSGESHEGYGPSPNPAPNPTPDPAPDPTPDPEPPSVNEPAEPENPDPNGGGGLFDDLWGIAM